MADSAVKKAQPDFNRPVIVFYQPAFLGDACLSVPSLFYLKKKFKEHNLIFIVRQELVDFFAKLDVADHVLGIKKKQLHTYEKVAGFLNQQQVDAILSPHYSFTSLRFLSRVKSKVKIGYAKGFGFLFFHKRVRFRNDIPDALRQLLLVDAFVSDSDSLIKKEVKKISALSAKDWSKNLSPELVPQINLSKDEQRFILDKYSLQKKQYYCVFPGSQWGSKMWTGYKDLCKQLAKKQMVVLLGSPSELEMCEKIRSGNPEVINLCGNTSVFESLLIVSECKKVICNDSGAQHLAALAGVESLSIFGPTVPRFGFAAFNPRSDIMENLNISCRPCGKHGHPQCPLGTHECMTSISHLDVLERV